MTNPDMIAHLINVEVARVWNAGTAFGEEAAFVDEPSGTDLLRLRFLVAVAHQLFPHGGDGVEMLDALLVIQTFLSPVSGPDPDSTETAAETLLNIAQNFYDEFRTE